ncbi:MAG: helix-turn-helix domain-containing protein [Candidatus Saccharimonadales bacterium]
MDQLLINAGLSALQARAYMFLIDNGSCAPKDLTKKLDITRTNTYKVLDSLDRLGLVHREKLNKRTIYRAADPSALASLVADKRNNIIALEQSVNEAMSRLRQKYNKNSSISLSSFAGKQAMISAYERQGQKGEPIYFIKSRSDIPFMGYDLMSSIRTQQSHKVPKRYGITTDSPEAQLSADFNLERTWINEEAYRAPIEWSVSGNELIVQVFDGNGAVIRIEHALIADSFRQIWSLASRAIQDDANYPGMPQKARPSRM